jgi:hypothetical protein
MLLHFGPHRMLNLLRNPCERIIISTLLQLPIPDLPNPNPCVPHPPKPSPLMRVNSTNILDEGLRIGETRRQMNSKVNSVKQGGYESKRGCRTWLAFNLFHTVPSWLLYIGGQVSRIGWDPIQITISIYDMNSYFD